VRRQVQRRGFAGSEEVGYILHLHKGHIGLLEANGRARKGEIRKSALIVSHGHTTKSERLSCLPDVPTKHCSIFERLEQVSRWQLFGQCLFNPVSDLVCGFGSISVHAELPHVLVEGRNRSHNGIILGVSLCYVVSLEVWRNDSVTWTGYSRVDRVEGCVRLWYGIRTECEQYLGRLTSDLQEPQRI